MRQFLTKLSLIFGTLALSATPVMAQVTTGMEAESDDEFAPSLSGEEIELGEGGDPESTSLNSTGNEVAVESVAVDSFFDIFTEFSRLDAKEYTADNVPTGGFGLWWKGVKESVSLAFTFNPVKKAEKQVRFAEERMGMAAAMIEKAADDPELQDKALDMIGKAQKFLDKVEDRKSKWLAEDGEARDNLLKNLGTHTALREAVFDRIEEKLPEEALDRFQDLRDQGHMAGRRLMTALENENIPEEIRDHLMGVKQRVEKFSEDLGIFKDVKKELLDLRAQGEEGIDKALDALHEERKETLRKRGKNLTDEEAEWLSPDRFSGGDPTGEKAIFPGAPEVGAPGEGLIGVPGVTIFPDASELRSRVLDRVLEHVPEFAPRGWILDRSETGDNIGSSGEDGVIRRRPVDDYPAPTPSARPIIDAILGVPAPGAVVQPEQREVREGALGETLVPPPPPVSEGSESGETSALEPLPPEPGLTVDVDGDQVTDPEEGIVRDAESDPVELEVDSVLPLPSNEDSGETSALEPLRLY